MKKIITETSPIIIISAVLYTSPYSSWLFVLMTIYALLTISWLFMRMTGRISMGHSFLLGFPVFLASAGYSISPDVSAQLFLAGCFLSFTIFYIFSEFTGRTAFVFLTLVFSILIWIVSPKFAFEINGYILGGEVGFNFPVIPQKMLHIIAGASLISLFVLHRVVESSRIGYFMRAIGDDETASKAVGIDLRKTKALSVFLSGVSAWSAGLIYAFEFGHVSPEIFSIEFSVFPFIASLLASGNPLFSVFSSFALVYLSKVLNSFYPGLMGIFYSIVLILSPKIGRWAYVKGKRLDEKIR